MERHECINTVIRNWWRDSRIQNKIMLMTCWLAGGLCEVHGCCPTAWEIISDAARVYTLCGSVMCAVAE